LIFLLSPRRPSLAVPQEALPDGLGSTFRETPVPAGLVSPEMGLVVGPPSDAAGGLELAEPGSGAVVPLSVGDGDGDGDVPGLLLSVGDGEPAGGLATGEDAGAPPGCLADGAGEQFTGLLPDGVMPGELTGDALLPAVPDVPEVPPPPPDGDPGVPTGEFWLLVKRLCGASKAT
jgi:hypothetical protein